MRLKAIIFILIVSNLATLFGTWFYKHNFEAMQGIVSVQRYLHPGSEYLAVTDVRLLATNSPHTLALMAIFKTKEECRENLKNFGDSPWECVER
jgi:hypothetical protein